MRLLDPRRARRMQRGTSQILPFEQRVARRVEFDATVDLQSDHCLWTGLTQNISTGGLFVATDTLRKVGERVTLRLMLPHARGPLTIDAEVRWIREASARLKRDGAPGMGLQFLDLEPQAATAIDRFMQGHDSLYHDGG